MKRLGEYSKRVIHLMIVLWFIGAAFGGAVVTAELIAVTAGDSAYTVVTVHLPELLNYISSPMTCGIVGYLLKAGFENREKIRQNSDNTYNNS